MLQETISLDGLLDKLLRHYIVNDIDIPADVMKNVISVCNLIFTKRMMIDEKYVEKRIAKIQGYREKLMRLREIPLVKQKSDEWYALRQSIITASDFAQALGDGKFGTQRDFYVKKAGYEKDVFNPYCPPLKWGNMFEDIACDIYKKRIGCTVYEFGLLKHPMIDHFGASPDGITDLGVMLEIKCPLKREIKANAEVPLQYYYQIQGQLDVCGLEECDYLECKFDEYDDAEGFYQQQDYEFEKGIIIELKYPDEDVPRYVYSDIVNGNKHKHDMLAVWEEDMKKQYADVFVKVHYWKLLFLNILRVYKNQEFLKEKMSMLKGVWDKIELYRNDKDLYDGEIGEKKKRTRSGKVGKYAFIDEP